MRPSDGPLRRARVLQGQKGPEETVAVIAVDTNVLVRLLVRDEPVQSALAKALFADGPVWLSATVLLETAWVLRKGFRLEWPEIVDALRRACALENVVVEDEHRFHDALDWAENGLDFADAFHLARAQDAESFYTFDRAFARRSRGLGVVPVRIVAPSGN